MMAQRRITGLLTLAELLDGLAEVVPSAEIVVSGLRIDSREVVAGEIFIALEGTRTSGTGFIDDAVKRGAVAVLVDARSGIDASAFPVPVYRLEDLQAKVGLIASRFFSEPSRYLSVTGITGTNGKTSIVWYLGQTLSLDKDRPVGCIGTLGYGEFGSLVPAINTTPDAITVQRLMDRFRRSRVDDVVMEVSSHALEQGRINGVTFNTAVFTNLTRDHLDYHASMSAYGSAKKRLFMSPGLRNAVINADDDFGAQLVNEFSGRLNVISYGLADSPFSANRPRPAVEAVLTSQQLDSLALEISSPWGSGTLTAGVSGKFNAYNLLATLAVLCLRGLPFPVALERLSAVRGVPGRMEYFGNAGSPGIFVDYSHTPDALKQALMSLRKQCKGKLVCVFGCGGDRDQGKRPQMGQVAEAGADRIILTSDNPRSESPAEIIRDIRSGMSGKVPVEVQTDRALAIRTAITTSSRDDIVLIAGKGHETWQEIGSTRLPFSDRQMVRNLLEETA